MFAKARIDHDLPAVPSLYIATADTLYSASSGTDGGMPDSSLVSSAVVGLGVSWSHLLVLLLEAVAGRVVDEHRKWLLLLGIS